MRPKNYDDFLADLDRESNLSDDPFGVDSIGSLDDDDLELLIPKKKPAAKAAAKPAAPKKRAPAKRKTSQ